jgi:hypothetical protein
LETHCTSYIHIGRAGQARRAGEKREEYICTNNIIGGGKITNVLSKKKKRDPAART